MILYGMRLALSSPNGERLSGAGIGAGARLSGVPIVKKLFGKRVRRRRQSEIKPMELHKGRWHPLFYKAVSVHILEATSKTGTRN